MHPKVVTAETKNQQQRNCAVTAADLPCSKPQRRSVAQTPTSCELVSTSKTNTTKPKFATATTFAVGAAASRQPRRLTVVHFLMADKTQILRKCIYLYLFLALLLSHLIRYIRQRCFYLSLLFGFTFLFGSEAFLLHTFIF